MELLSSRAVSALVSLPMTGQGLPTVDIMDQTVCEKNMGIHHGKSAPGGAAQGAAVDGDTSSNYKLCKVIGEGNDGQVYRAISPSSEAVAIKVIDINNLKRRHNVEIETMRYLKGHPNIVNFHEVIQMDETNSIGMVMDLATNGTVLDLLINEGKRDEATARHLFRQILAGVNFAHSRYIIHRDLKAENILVQDDGSLVVADWGFSTQWRPGLYHRTSCGSPPYAAPEICDGGEYVGPEVDVWSLGVLLFALNTARLPFGTAKKPRVLYDNITNARFTCPPYFSSALCDLVKSIFTVNPLLRPSITQILRHPWFTKRKTSRLSSVKKIITSADGSPRKRTAPTTAPTKESRPPASGSGSKRRTPASSSGGNSNGARPTSAEAATPEAEVETKCDGKSWDTDSESGTSSSSSSTSDSSVSSSDTSSISSDTADSSQTPTPGAPPPSGMSRVVTTGPTSFKPSRTEADIDEIDKKMLRKVSRRGFLNKLFSFVRKRPRNNLPTITEDNPIKPSRSLVTAEEQQKKEKNLHLEQQPDLPVDPKELKFDLHHNLSGKLRRVDSEPLMIDGRADVESAKKLREGLRRKSMWA
eukprot:TRINITY_DN13006_c0_g1_i1.p1 TRINITY_DN13006_c0_g1~~TRINITY_DN13006_c0_g1_i1.p1  ORF type:complete len:587 (-),score=111.33 TRINITY_DN13006_c0_g1_i1:108-1868(-)